MHVEEALSTLLKKETTIAGADSKSLARSIRQRGQVEPIYVSDINDLAELLDHQLTADDMVITQGAGNIGVVARNLIKDERFNLKEQHD